MSPFSGGNGDLIPEDTGLIHVGGVFLLHAHRAAATADISGEAQQLLHMDQLHIFVPSGLGSLLQVQFAAHRDAEYINTGPFAPGHQRLEHLL